MDRTDRMINEIKKIVKTNELTIKPKDLMNLDMIVEGVQAGKISMFNIMRGKHDFELSPTVMDILKTSYNKAVPATIEQRTESNRNL